MADPEFPRRGGATPKVGVKTYYLANFFLKNCMKMKEFGPSGGGARVPGAPLRSATDEARVNCHLNAGRKEIPLSLPPAIRRMGEGNSFSLFTSGGGGGVPGLSKGKKF